MLDAEAPAHVIPFPPQRTPPVATRALLAAWDAARAAASAHLEGPPRRFRFAPAAAGQAPSDLLLADRDARCWAEAIDRRTGLDTAEGIATLLRLLALVEVMGRAPWLRDHFEIGRGGTLLHPALLRAAAVDPLDAGARFDEEGLRRRLTRPRIAGPSPAGARPA
ncbi:hypothetical protein [Muricoccus radiodurans]|uniref:hypothetical protein n=1 Tax=Muricoccus radiodurans TaxID=2231721 RepID=UPI003CEDCBA6